MSKRFKLIFGSIARRWDELRGTTVVLSLVNRQALLSMFISGGGSSGWCSLHLFVWPGGECVYWQPLWPFSRQESDEEQSGWWIWGRCTEPYDRCLEYFGLGPLFLVCWR